jgi:hypothetical protein
MCLKKVWGKGRVSTDPAFPFAMSISYGSSKSPQTKTYYFSTLLGELRFSSIPFLICTFREVEVVARNLENPDPPRSED